MDKRIIPLAIGGLGIGTTEFAIMGLLPNIANSLHTSIPEAGHFISAYAMGVVVGAPIIVAYAKKFQTKKVLIFLMLLFAVFNFLSAFAPNYYAMLGLRFLSGLPHGAFFGISTVVAKRLATKGKEARNISHVFLGLTVANFAMVPLVTFLGNHFNWSWCFIIVSVIGLLSALLIQLWIPVTDQPEQKKKSNSLNFLKRANTWYVLLITAIGFGGLFTWLSYISPLMTTISGIAESNVAYIMILAGSGMVVGNLFGGFLTDKIGAYRASIYLLSAMSIALLGVFYLSSFSSFSIILTFLCGTLSMALAAPVNIMMLKAAPDSEMMSAAFMQAAFNVANAAGAFFGGIPLIFGLDYNYPSLVGVGMTLIGLFISYSYSRKLSKAS